MVMPLIVDSHCHLDFEGLRERLPEVLARARDHGVRLVVTIGTRVRQFAATRALAEVSFSSVVGHRLNSPEGLVDAIRTAALIALSAEQVGAAQAALDRTVEYAKSRKQFGRTIGSFQALKHRMADMYALVETARSISYAAARSQSREDAAAAKAYCSDAYFQNAADSLQIHGGVGFTWEYDVHLHLKRAKWSESFLGDPAWHRERVARLVGLG